MGLAQNEMKAKRALPERVRSMEGLGLTAAQQLVEHLFIAKIAPRAIVSMLI